MLLNDPPPATAHCTPALFESFVTLAVRVAVCAWSSALALDVNWTAIGLVELPQPTNNEINTTRKSALEVRAADVIGTVL
jgi:hypothetical protein